MSQYVHCTLQRTKELLEQNVCYDNLKFKKRKRSSKNGRFRIETARKKEDTTTWVNNIAMNIAWWFQCVSFPPTGANEVEIMAKPNRDNGREYIRIRKCSRQIYGLTSSSWMRTWKLFHYRSGWRWLYLHRLNALLICANILLLKYFIYESCARINNSELNRIQLKKKASALAAQEVVHDGPKFTILT